MMYMWTQKASQQKNAQRGRIIVACCYSMLAVAIASALPVAAAMAQANSAQVTAKFDIPAADLATALDSFSTQSGIQLLYRNDLVVGKRAKALHGTLDAQRALQRLLEGSGVSFERNDAKTWVLKAAATAPASAPAPVTSSSRNTDGSKEQNVTQLPDVMVRGNRTLNMDIRRTQDDIQPYVVFDREQIQNSGAVSLGDFLRLRLTAQGGAMQFPGSDGGGRNSSSVSLRGLGSEQTLLLIDGRRAPPRENFGGSPLQADLNGIPINAVDRIEVLPASASAIHGGGATGGVVNVVLRRDYQGLETTFTYDNTFRGGGLRRRLDIAGGFNLEDGKTSVMLVGSWSQGASLLAEDRNFLQRGRTHAMAHDPQSVLTALPLPIGATTNILSLSGTPLILKPQWGGTTLGASQTYVPYGYGGVASDNGAGLVANAGSYNFDPPATAQLGGSRTSILNEPEVKSLNLSLRRQFTPNLDVYVDATTSENRGRYSYILFNSGQYILPAAAPANPFIQDIVVSTPLFGINQYQETIQKDRRATFGAVYALGQHWKVGVDAVRGRAETIIPPSVSMLGPEAQAAVRAGATASGAPFDVFRDTNLHPVDFSNWLGEPDRYSPRVMDTRNLSLRAAGALPWSLPAGAPTLSILLEDRQEESDGSLLFQSEGAYDFISRYPGVSQRIRSGYIEAQVPIFSERNAIWGARQLDLQLALRRDNYRQEGGLVTEAFSDEPWPETPPPGTREFSSTDHTVGMLWQPVSDLTLRASFATGFLPPNIGLLAPNPPRTRDLTYLGLVDPRRGGEPIGVVTALNGGNPDLRPEQSRTHTVGLIWMPQAWQGLRMSVDWVRIRKHDNTRAFNPEQRFIDAESLILGYLERGPASDGYEVGPIRVIDSRHRNVMQLEVEALDVSIDAEHESAVGTWGVHLSGTRNLRHDERVLDSLPEQGYVGYLTALPWQSYLELSWERDAWHIQWSTRYFDGYCIEVGCTQMTVQTRRQGGPKVPGQTYHDVVMRWRAPISMQGWLMDTEVQLGIRNVFDRYPPVDMSNMTHLYSSMGDPRLSSWFASITKRF